MPTLVESVAEWTERHTKEGPAVVDPDTRNELFATGALRTPFGNAEPPEEPGNLLRMRRKYWFITLMNEREAWEKAKAGEMETASNAVRFAGVSAPCPTMSSVDQLKVGKARVAKLLKKVTELDEEISRLPEEIAIVRQQEIIRERQRKAEQVLNALQAQTLDDL